MKTELNNYICVLFSGRAGVGKTTCATILGKHLMHLRYKVNMDHFARPIKEMATKYFFWNGIKDIKGRKLLQDLGKLGRDFDEDVWVRYVCEQEENHLNDFFIIDDWRFPNEYDFINKFGIHHIYKIKILAPNREILRGTDLYNDISESSLPEELDYYDIIINNSTIELDKLNSLLRDLAKSLIKNHAYEKEN